ncbi:glycosyltransferase [Sediminibacterium salmoneum]|uniref:glycosyltransferase n=1 Tax=Sediminibacterium salmoneum TaxID=426421 RepID=UPI0004B00706|nr:glycosyltransferase [Sediminibacterium salmoneum]
MTETVFERIPSTPPIIPPLPAGTKRLKWSVMVPVYNGLVYLEQTLNSILVQDMGSEIMQIEVVDDVSTEGDVAAIVERVGNGRVGYYRQPVNVGNVRNFETCIKRSVGEYVHILHGDDYVEPGFYKAITRLFEDFPDAGAACTDWKAVDDNGKVVWENAPVGDERGLLKNWHQRIAIRQWLEPPAVVVKRSVYEDLGSFYMVHCCEDWLMWNRIAAKYPVAYHPEVLAKYRNHDQNITAISFKNRKNFFDIYNTMLYNIAHLPEHLRVESEKASRKNYAFYFANLAHRQYHANHDKEEALIVAKDAMKFQVNAYSVKSYLKLLFKIAMRYK